MTSKQSTSSQIAALPRLAAADLWLLWDQHFARRPPRVSRQYIEARLAYRIQELSYGGLAESVRKHLADCGERQSKIKVGRNAEVHLMPGTVLVREFDSREHRVTVTPDGMYEIEGKRFKSLSAAARHITGTQWSGPAFFGLARGRK